jgi:3-methyladenine DNA glycosylase AlkD
MSKGILTTIREELKHAVDPATRHSFQSFFKEKVTAYGVKTAVVEKIARKHFPEVKALGKRAVLALCEELWKSDYTEEAFIACEWAYRLESDYEPEDFKVFERWLSRYVDNWAKCDTLSNHTIGAFIEKYPRYIADLKRWARSDNRWMRRAAAATLILPARRGKFLDDVLEIAGILLHDKDDLVQKGYGWMLKEASRLHQKEIFDYVMSRRAVMPRTALRYAIEKMPPDLRREAMEKP